MKDMNIDAKKTFWRDAVRGGTILGLVIFGFSLLNGVTDNGVVTRLLSLAEFLVMAGCIYGFSRKRGMRYSAQEGYSYGQSFGFILAMMLFVGIFAGCASFLLVNYIRPEHFEATLDMALETNPMITGEHIDMMHSMLKNPILQIVSGVFGMLIYGGLIGLIASAFVKRKPDIFAANPDGDLTDGDEGDE